MLQVTQAESTFEILPVTQKKDACDFFSLVGERLRKAVVSVTEHYGAKAAVSSEVPATEDRAAEAAAPPQEGTAPDSPPVIKLEAIETVREELTEQPLVAKAHDASVAMETDSESPPVMENGEATERQNKLPSPGTTAAARTITLKEESQMEKEDLPQREKPVSGTLQAETEVAKPLVIVTPGSRRAASSLPVKDAEAVSVHLGESFSLVQIEDLKNKISMMEKENICLKECVWKISHADVEESATNSEEIVSRIVSNLVDKAVFLAETHDSLESLETVVNVELAVQNYPAIVKPPKRKRGRPPKTPTNKSPKAKKPRSEVEIDQSIVKVEPTGPWEDGTDNIEEDGEEVEGVPTRKINTRLRRRSQLQSKEKIDVLKEELGKVLFNRIVSDDEIDSSSGLELPPVASDQDDEDFDPAAPEASDDEPAVRPRRRKPGRPRRSANYVGTAPKRPHKRMIRHICQVCKKSFYHGRPFNRHLLSHGKAKCSCRRCHQQFFNYAVLLNHPCLRPKAKTKKHPCPQCDEVFATMKTLGIHLREVHNAQTMPVQPFSCKYCDQKFAKRSAMYAHFEEHAEGKLVCQKCGHFCTDKESLDEHMSTEHQHENAGYSCDSCGAAFNSQQKFTLHVEGQNKNQCPICDQRFCTKKLLDFHNKQAHGLKTGEPALLKYTCPECNKMFQRPGQLQIHMRIHTGRMMGECHQSSTHMGTVTL